MTTDRQSSTRRHPSGVYALKIGSVEMPLVMYECVACLGTVAWFRDERRSAWVLVDVVIDVSGIGRWHESERHICPGRHVTTCLSEWGASHD